MAVDRASRDLLAQALADYLRQDIDFNEFCDRTKPVEHLLDPFDAVEEADVLLRFCGQALQDAHFGIDGYEREAWDRLCRCIVFLDTDREYVGPPAPVGPVLGPGPLDDPRKYRLHLLGFASSGVLVFFEGWWPLLSWWVLSFILLFIVGNLEQNRRWREWADRHPLPPDFDPFRDEADWNANAYRLARFRLPVYDPEFHGPRPAARGIVGKVILVSIGAVMLIALGVLVLGLMFLFWPVSVLTGAMQSTEEATPTKPALE